MINTKPITKYDSKNGVFATSFFKGELENFQKNYQNTNYYPIVLYKSVFENNVRKVISYGQINILSPILFSSDSKDAFNILMDQLFDESGIRCDTFGDTNLYLFSKNNKYKNKSEKTFVIETKEEANACISKLTSLAQEREELLKESDAKFLDEFNSKNKNKLPFIVVMIENFESLNNELSESQRTELQNLFSLSQNLGIYFFVMSDFKDIASKNNEAFNSVVNHVENNVFSIKTLHSKNSETLVFDIDCD
jgi:hypothetical protein